MKRLAGKSIVLGLAVAAVVLTVAGGLFLLGSPAQERMHRLDERRVDDLRRISQAVDLFSTRHGRLPASLGELSREPGVNVSFRDPTTAELYEYRALGPEAYELCALFQGSTAEAPEWMRGGFWSHGAGRHCFQLETREVGR